MRLTQDNKDFSNFSGRQKRQYLLELRIRGLRADFVAELEVEPEPEYRTLLKCSIDSLHKILRCRQWKRWRQDTEMNLTV